MLVSRRLLIFALIAVLLFALRPDVPSLTPPPGRMQRLPSVTLRVWERPEDLRTIDPRTTAIAALDRTLVLGRAINLIPRRQSYVYSAGTRRISVVRIEAPGSIAPVIKPFVVDAILEDASHPGIAALQIDFDARRSQRDFYAAQLPDLRRRMPPGLPLSITVLASWCSSDDWIPALPVYDAVPMRTGSVHLSKNQRTHLKIDNPVIMSAANLIPALSMARIPPTLVLAQNSGALLSRLTVVD